MSIDKLQKLRDLLKLLQNDTITPKQVEEFLVVVLKVIKDSKDTFESLSQANLKNIAEALQYIQNQKKGITDNFSTEAKKASLQLEKNLKESNDFLAAIKKIKSTPGKPGYSPIKGIDYFDGLPGQPGAPGSTDTRLEIVEKINTGGQEDQKIKAEQIEGIEKLATEANTRRAIDILDKRTQFLINKPGGGLSSVSHDATLTGDGTPGSPLSVVGSSSSVGILSTTTGIDAKTVATTNLYTVPVGKTAIITGIDILVTAATAVAVPPTVGVGIAAGEDDIFNPTSLTGLDSTTELYRGVPLGTFVKGNAADVIKLGIDVGATATTMTITVILLGYLV